MKAGFNWWTDSGTLRKTFGTADKIGTNTAIFDHTVRNWYPQRRVQKYSESHRD